MYDDLLKQIASEMSRQALQPPCSVKDLGKLKHRSKNELGVALPTGYLQFLAITNGLVWNGLSIFASKIAPLKGLSDVYVQGIVEANKEYRVLRHRDPMEDYLIIGEDGVAFFTYHIPHDDYKVVSIVGMDVHVSYNTFDELLVDALQGHV